MIRLQFGGQERFTQPADVLFKRLTDLESVALAIPDLVSSRLVDPHTLECVIRPGVSFLRGTLRLAVRLADVQPSQSATYRFVTRGIGAEIVVLTSLQFVPEPSGTLLTWRAEVVELKGLVATLSRSLIAAAAEKQITATWQRIREQLANPADQ